MPLRGQGGGAIELDIGEFYFWHAMQFHRHVVNNGFGQIDHRRKIDIGLIKFERGEFRVMARTQALVAEAAIDFE
jgi:hypothetical protein